MELKLLPPVNESPDLLIIAGEHSGDEHAARLVSELKNKHKDITVFALGGSNLRAAGAHVIFDLTEHSVVGLTEVLKKIFFFKRLFKETLFWIKKYQPKAVCFVDYPGFNLRMAEALYKKGISHKAGGDVNLCYYIGPQIWAWKAHRRFKMAKYLDALAVIFPFEINCYADTDLPVTFVGHPFLSKKYTNNIKYNQEGPVLLLPGSRKTPVERMLPTMLDAYDYALKELPDLKATLVYPSKEIKEVLEVELMERRDLKDKVTLKYCEDSIEGCALVGSSGTMSLRCALAGIPGTVIYKTNPVTYFFGKLLVSIKYMGMANILLGKDVYPEHIQGDAKAETLGEEIIDCIQNKERQQAMVEDAEAIRIRLTQDQENLEPVSWIEPYLDLNH